MIRRALLGLIAATALLAAAPTTASAATTYTAGWILNPGDKVYMPWPSFNCNASNYEGTYVYQKATYLSASPYYRFILFFYVSPEYQRAVLFLDSFMIESRAPFTIRVWCVWPP